MFKCLYCNNTIESKYAKKYCSSSCAAKSNNKKFPKRKKGREYSCCLNCNSILFGKYSGKYCNNKCQGEYKVKQKINGIKGGNIKSIKKYLIESKLLPLKCNSCNLETIWNGKPLLLELHHINGIRTDNSLQNLVLLCPNCHSQTDNYKHKNIKNAPVSPHAYTM